AGGRCFCLWPTLRRDDRGDNVEARPCPGTSSAYRRGLLRKPSSLLALAGLQWLIQNDYIDEREALQTGYSLTPKGYAALYLLGCILRRCAAAAQFLFGDPPHDGRGGSQRS